MSSSPEYIHSEKPAIDLLQRMGYTYIKSSQIPNRSDKSQFLLYDRLKAAIRRLNPWMNESNVNKAFHHLTGINGASLMEINEAIWQVIRGDVWTVKQVIEGEEGFHPVRFIDYQHPEQNDFLVVNQMAFKGTAQDSIPDLVVYVNGMPIAVIECKAPAAQNAWHKAYGDLTYYQSNSEKLFHFNQICVGLWKIGGKYGAIQAPKKFYSVYRPDKGEDLTFLGEHPSAQAILLYALFRKDRLLELIRHFVVFELDEGTTLKKLPRYQQLRATNKTIAKLQTDKGGVIWHTQGSGKSITMVYITRKLQAPEMGFDNPTILILTDRKDLDTQITTTFQNVGFKNVQQAHSVTDLDALLRNDYGGIITSTLQKFQEAKDEQNSKRKHSTTNEKIPPLKGARGMLGRKKNGKMSPNHKGVGELSVDELDQTELEENEKIRIQKEIKNGKFIKTVFRQKKGKWKADKPIEVPLEKLSDKKNLYVLVDEAHRSHYGFLAAFMRHSLPHAKFVAFTGTPLSKEEKSTLYEFYGGDKYIDVYTIKESVEDGATVELLYDEGIAQMQVKKEELDKEFEEKFGHLPAAKKDKLMREALQKYQFSIERIESICTHLLEHYSTKIRPDGHKAMIVCNGRHLAIRYQQMLQKMKKAGKHDFDSKVVISISSPKTDSIANDFYKAVEWNKKHPQKTPKPIWATPPEEVKTVTEHFKLPFGDESDTEKSGKKKHDNTAFLIVSDMLLTGYDVPVAACLYLDKSLKEHNLLQAIARVNRSRKGKNAGFIMDYYGITSELIEALKMFSGEVELRPEDVLKNLSEELPQLAMHHSKLVDFFKPLRINRLYKREEFIDAALRYIEAIDKRDHFKTLLKQFNKSINIVLPSPKAMPYRSDFLLFNELRLRAKNAFPDDEELKVTQEESQMLQALIDKHLKAEGVANLLEEPISIIDREKFEQEIENVSPATKELKMRNQLKYIIKVGLDKNPDFYKPLAQRLEELLKQKETKRINEAQLLLAYAELQNTIIDEQQEAANQGFKTEQKREVYQSLKIIFGDKATDATQTVFDLIEGELGIVEWQEKNRVKKDIVKKITRFLQSIGFTRPAAKVKAESILDLLVKNR